MKNFVFVFIFFSATLCGAQTVEQVDSLTIKMCESLNTLKNSSEQTDSQTRMEMVFRKHIPTFLDDLPIASQEEADSLVDKIFFRLQKNCYLFVAMLSEMEEGKGDWAVHSERPAASITKKECRNFYTGGNFYYKEPDGKIVKVTITKTHWTETFEDQTTSNLFFHRKKDCGFELEFIESNNHTRKNFSIKGDTYMYGVFAINEGIYSIWAAVDGEKIFNSFLLYPAP